MALATVVTGGLLISACAERGPTEPGTRFPRGSVVPPDPSTVVLCKDASSPAGSYSFAITTSGNDDNPGDVVVPSVSLEPGGCATVWSRTTVDGTSEPVANVTIVETPAPGTTVDKIEAISEGGPPVYGADGRTVTVFVNRFHLARVTYFNKKVGGDQGCTPGYWKNHENNPTYKALAGLNMNAYFGVTFFPANLTLGQALDLGGGGVNALARHAAAGAMNATAGSGVNYAYTTAEVKAIVQSASSIGYEAAKDKLEAANEGRGGCPLGNDKD